MKVILSIGSPDSGHEQVFNLLTQAGVKPAIQSRIGSLSPELLQAKMLASVGHDPQPSGLPTAVHPGKMWNELASDLFIANMEQPLWGFADQQSARFMDFWLDFDPQVRLMLVYSPPYALIDTLRSNTDAAALDAALAQWVQWNSYLLRYYHRHPGRCVLINGLQALARPQECIEQVAKQWQIDGLWAMPANAAALPPGQALQDFLACLKLGAEHAGVGLYQELEAVALVPGPASKDFSGAPLSAPVWEDWVALRSLLEAQTASLAAVLPVVACPQCALVAAELAQAQREGAEIRRQLDRALRQQQQLQVELEHYFLRYHEHSQKSASTSASGFLADFWRMQQPAEIVVDMTRSVAGENWYDAEPDGRWAGPAEVSSLVLPPVQTGLYELTLDIVDAMAPEIVTNLCLEIVDEHIQLEAFELVFDYSYPVAYRAQVCIGAGRPALPWRVSLRFSRLVAPSDTGGDDQRRLAIRLRSLRLVQLS